MISNLLRSDTPTRAAGLADTSVDQTDTRNLRGEERDYLVEELKRRHNDQWLIERLDCGPPAHDRRALTALIPASA
jgi:hypothetical protein